MQFPPFSNVEIKGRAPFSGCGQRQRDKATKAGASIWSRRFISNTWDATHGMLEKPVPRNTMGWKNKKIINKKQKHKAVVDRCRGDPFRSPPCTNLLRLDNCVCVCLYMCIYIYIIYIYMYIQLYIYMQNMCIILYIYTDSMILCVYEWVEVCSGKCTCSVAC